MSRRFYTLDVFAGRALAGNPLAVVIDADGLDGAAMQKIAREFNLSETVFVLPPDEPLTLAAYSAGTPKTAYVEPTAVGRELIDMPLFLEPETYVNVPLEATYQAAYRGVPRRWRQVLE